MKKLVISILVLLLVSVIVILLQYPDTKVRVITCDVGQGDGILIQQAFFQIVVDGGPGNRLLTCLGKHMPFWDRTIEVVILTHPQADHYEGLIPLFSRYQVKHFIASAYPGSGEHFDQLVAVVSQEPNLNITIPHQGQILRQDELELEIIWPRTKVGNKLDWKNLDKVTPSKVIDDPNIISTVGILRYKSFSVLLTGDIGVPEEVALISNGVLTDIDVLKIAHHGSKHSSSTDFLRLVDPELVLVSVGAKNSYGHPAKDALDRVTEVNAKMYRTDEVGDVVVVTDGHSYWVE